MRYENVKMYVFIKILVYEGSHDQCFFRDIFKIIICAVELLLTSTLSYHKQIGGE